ncbi:glycosyltransferase [Pseudoalteromonas sp. YIC-827]|uniref:Glycosyltransferase n=1 Tax=Pseudoalteromonas qingdaonensis TaxID=3131913 RepID=A0ABU9MXR4_9GAMM
MKTIFIHDHVFAEFNGRFFSEGKLTDYTWSRYLKFTEELLVVGRRRLLKNAEQSLKLNETLSPNVSFSLINSISLIDRANAKKIDRFLEPLIEECDVVICRLPSFLGTRAFKIAQKNNKKTLCEVVGCPYDALKTHGSFLGKLAAPIVAKQLKAIMRQTQAAIYVTAEYLQSKYPTDGSWINASNVELKEHFIRASVSDVPTVVKFIGSLDASYKGLNDLIDALSILNDKGFDLKLHVLGSGSRQEYQKRVTEYGLQDKVHFFDPIPGGEAVLKWLAGGDLYVQSSHTEGLPRALIEAMSVGLPCVGTKVGGIPELLSPEALCEAKAPSQLAKSIERVLIDSDFRELQIEANQRKASDYLYDILQSKRLKFIETIYRQ